MKCEICGQTNLKLVSFGTHLTRMHPTITQKDYFDKYLKTNNDGICLCCGKPTKFIKITQGYEKYCSVYCEPNINKSNIVVCNICGEAFKSTKSLGQHIKNIHKDKEPEIECLICYNKIKNCREFTKHLKKYHNKLTPKNYYDIYLKHNDNEGICPICKKVTSFVSITKGYLVCCSPSCAAYYDKDKREQTNLERYGTKNVYASDYAKCKMKQTKLKKYNNPNYVNPKKMKQTKLDKYGEYYINSEKTKSTNLERYGVEWTFQSDIVKEKTIKTLSDKYGTVTNAMQVEVIKQKVKETNKKRYGVTTTLQNKQVKEKAVNTIVNKYGVDNIAKLESTKQKMIETRNNNIKQNIELDREIENPDE